MWTGEYSFVIPKLIEKDFQNPLSPEHLPGDFLVPVKSPGDDGRNDLRSNENL